MGNTNKYQLLARITSCQSDWPRRAFGRIAALGKEAAFFKYISPLQSGRRFYPPAAFE